MDPSLPQTVIDIIDGKLSGRFSWHLCEWMTILCIAYLHWLSTKCISQLFQRGNLLGLRSDGLTKIQGPCLLSKAIRSHLTEPFEVEFRVAFQVFPYDFNLWRWEGGEHVG